MTLTYNKLSKTPRIFNNLTGLTIDQFNQLLDSVQDEIISKFKTRPIAFVLHINFIELRQFWISSSCMLSIQR